MPYMNSNDRANEAINDGIIKRSSLDANEVNGKITTNEQMIHALWLLLQRMGVTNEQLDEALTEVMEINARGVVSLKGMACPQCGSKAQFNGPFKIKCIYCGTEAVLNPYEARELAEQANAVIAEQQALEEQQKRWEEAQKNNPYQPYDVTKDLNFDDLM
ncbi:MAG: hypothetical protein MJ094_04775 [Saccharofermentans sp.]|nr:hypothetical protein [Saccharofermentans sp.]